jgi:hypothetical protein
MANFCFGTDFVLGGWNHWLGFGKYQNLWIQIPESSKFGIHYCLLGYFPYLSQLLKKNITI